MARKKWLPDNVTEYKDRHGKARYRFRKRGVPDYHFKSVPGTPGFMQELAAAQKAERVERQRFAPFTYDALIEDFYRLPEWTEAKDSTRKTYGNVIERFRKDNGVADVRQTSAGNIQRKLSRMKDRPAAANTLRKVLARLHRHAILLGWRTDNPAVPTKGYKPGKGHHPWSEEELAAFDARWSIGTKERLAKELLLNTALRKTDSLTVGPANRKGDHLALYHSKNDSHTEVRMSADLIAAIDACPAKGKTYIETIYGKPYTPTGFYNWFKRACVKAGLPHCSPHGLRKAMSRRLAEYGATSLQGRAVTGHKTDKEFARYAESANRRQLADAALANLPQTFATTGAENQENHK